MITKALQTCQVNILTKNTSYAKHIAEWLAVDGINCSLINDLCLAMEQLENDSVDAIICEIEFVTEDSLTLIKRFNNRHSTRFVPWIFIYETADRKSCLNGQSEQFYCFPKSSLNFDKVKRIIQASFEWRRNNFIDLILRIEKLSGIALKLDKNSYLGYAIRQRKKITNIEQTSVYVDYAIDHPDEIAALIQLLTINTTFFFREKDSFGLIEKYFFNRNLKNNKPLKIWSAACSTGEEVYTLVILALEYARSKNIPYCDLKKKFKIIGTDINQSCIEIAREGVYQSEQITRIPEMLRRRYFDRGTAGLERLYRVKDKVWDLCQFDTLNLLSNFDKISQQNLIIARNVFLYFQNECIRTIVHKFYDKLKPTGYLLLSSSEHIDDLNLPFKTYSYPLYKTKTNDSNSKAKTSIKDNKKEKRIHSTTVISSKGLILIGASTGGIEALSAILRNLPKTFPPILIVQHIVEGYTDRLSQLLNQLSSLKVSEAEDGRELENGMVLVGKAGIHLKVNEVAGKLFSHLTMKEYFHEYHKPAIDELFISAVPLCKNYQVIPIILTGMGDDGSLGIRQLKDAGALTYAQDEATSAVFGMPKKAIAVGGVTQVLPLDKIAPTLVASFMG